MVCRSICHSNERVETAELIEMPFGLRTWVGPWNHVLDGGPHSPMGGDDLEPGGRPILKRRTVCRELCKKE